MELRWYQEEAIASVWESMRRGCNPCVVAPTGSGKSLIIAEIARQARKWGGRSIILAHRKELLEQNASKVSTLLPGETVGVYSAGLRRRDTKPDIIVAGIQSIYKRACELDARHVCVIDEAHLISPDEGTMYKEFLDELKRINPYLKIVGLTATPYRTGEGSVIDGGMLNEICYEVPVRRLVDEGYLCQLTNKPTTQVDMRAVDIRRGEYVAKQMEDAFIQGNRVQIACREIVNMTTDRKSILVFTCGVAHAQLVTDELERLAGEEVGLVTGETESLLRASLINRFQDGSLRWLVNVNVLCLDEQTEILCREGWVGIDEMTPEHNVACWENDRICFAPPKTIVRRPRFDCEKMASLKTNGIDIRVTSNHQMIVRGGVGSMEWTKRLAEDICGKRVKLPAHGMAIPEVFELLGDGNKKRHQHRIRSLAYVYRKKYGMGLVESRDAAVEEVVRKSKLKTKLPSNLSDEECQFIGFWIGDGTMSCGRCSLSQSFAYTENIAWVDEVLKKIGIAHSRRIYKPARGTQHKSVRWTLARGTGSRQQQVEKGYFELEAYLIKNGSELLWGLSRSQLLNVFDGWWRADGLHHSKWAVGKSICCTDKRLLDHMQAIATCRGIRTSITMCSLPRRENHSQQWRFSWSSAAQITLGRHLMQIESDYTSERVWCVTSETGNIVTRRNGKVTVVGNTTGFDAPNIDAIAVMRATVSPGLFAQIVGRGFRIHPSKANCLILDFGQNCERHGPLDDPQYGRKPKPDLNRESGSAVRACPACQEEMPISAIWCPSCGMMVREPSEPKHEEKADTQADLLKAEHPPEDFIVIEVNVARHISRKADKPDTLRVDYLVQREEGGNLSELKISEWKCFNHSEGWAIRDARKWAALHTIAQIEGVEHGVLLFNSGAMRMPTRIRAKRDGKFWRVIDRHFEDDRPTSWQELEPEEEEAF